MGVIFRGGTSGNREGALPPVPSSGSSQPVLDTATTGAVPSTIQFGDTSQAYPMPTGGTDATGSDLEDADATGFGPAGSRG